MKKYFLIFIIIVLAVFVLFLLKNTVFAQECGCSPDSSGNKLVCSAECSSNFVGTDCFTNSDCSCDCSPDSSGNKLVCSSGCGVGAGDECQTSQQCVTGSTCNQSIGENRPHWECVNEICTRFDSCGKNTCSDNGPFCTKSASNPSNNNAYQGYKRGECTTTLTINNPMTYCAKADQDGKCLSGNTIAYDGLVPCGKCVILNPNVDSNGKPVLTNGTLSGSAKYIDCQFCHFLVMFKGIVDWIVSLLVPVLAALMLIIAGVSFFLGGNNPSMVINAKKTLWAVVIGVAIIYGAWIIVNTFLTFPGFVNLDVNGLDLRKWFQVNCPIKLP